MVFIERYYLKSKLTVKKYNSKCLGVDSGNIGTRADF